MQDFRHWLEQKLSERGIRTSLGIYPDLYGAGQYPPLYFAPISAVAATMLKKLHPQVIKNAEKPAKPDKKKSKKKSKTEKKSTAKKSSKKKD